MRSRDSSAACLFMRTEKGEMERGRGEGGDKQGGAEQCEQYRVRERGGVSFVISFCLF